MNTSEGNRIAIPPQLLKETRQGRCILYAGAGFSKEASLPDGGKLPGGDEVASLLRSELAKGDALRGYAATDLKSITTRYEQIFGRPELVLSLFKVLGPDGLSTGEAHELAIKLFPIITTTNYDSLFERAAYLQGRQPMIIQRDSQVPLIGRGTWPTIIKLHGDLNDPERIVITERDYEEKKMSSLLGGELISNLTKYTSLFAGYTMEDSDFRDAYLDEVLPKVRKQIHRAFLVAPISSGSKEERDSWSLRRMEWEPRGIEFVDCTAGTLLSSLYAKLNEREQPIDPLEKTESGSSPLVRFIARLVRSREI
jgi:hypothetical protein